MHVVLDTNCLIRFFTNDIPEKAAQVQNLLDSEKSLEIPDVVFPELEYVLMDAYNVSRAQLITIYKFILSRNTIKVSSSISRAVELFENTDLDMADCIIGAKSEKGALASFDKKLLRIKNITAYWDD